MAFTVTYSGSKTKKHGVQYTKTDACIFVDDVNGDDDYGIGTQYGAGPTHGRPYATWARAYEDIKDVVIAHNIRILGETPTSRYVGFPTRINPHVVDSGSLSFAGLGVPVPVEETVFEISTVAYPVNDGGTALVVAPVDGFGDVPADAYYGKYMLMTGGSSVGAYYPIFSSTLTDLIVGYKQEYILIPTDEFQIVSPGVLIDTATSRIEVCPQIDGVASNSLSANKAAISFFNLDFDMTGAMPNDEIFRISNPGDVYMAFTSVKYGMPV